MRKREEGITLISLTITIIVMIILASILIRATSGIDEWEETVGITENIYEENKEEVEDRIESINEKWGNVINKKTIDSEIN